jgi:hypothetical protein
MRRLYVLPKSIFTGQIRTGTHAEIVSEDGKSLKAIPVMVDVVKLFHPMIGAHYIDLPNEMILMCTSFDHSEAAEDLFHSHPEVAILPHPTLMGNVSLKEHIGNRGHRFQQQHMEALISHADMNVQDSDTVTELARKASTIHPEVRFRNVL